MSQPAEPLVLGVSLNAEGSSARSDDPSRAISPRPCAWTSPTKPPASCDGHQFESPQLHQEVGAKRRDFLCHRIARHFRSLPVLARARDPTRLAALATSARGYRTYIIT